MHSAIFATKMILVLCIAVVSLKLCSAQHLVCNITRHPRGFLYSVPELQATKCPYSWTNSTGHVLANEKNKLDELVLHSSIRTLLTNACLDQVNYTRICVSERIQRTAYCFTDCRTPEPLKRKISRKQQRMPWHHWGDVVSISIAVVVLLGLIFSALMRRNNQSSQSSIDNVEGAHHT